MNKLEIEIPEGQEIDWQESAKQEKIVFKNKQLTYEEMCEELFKNGHYFIDASSKIYKNSFVAYDPNAASTKHQLECILAKNKLANVARYLNGDWTKKEQEDSPNWVIFFNTLLNQIIIQKTSLYSEKTNVLFKYKELAQQAIDILGEETVKLALTPLY